MVSPTEQFVYIIIPVHNRKQIAIACLENLNTCGDLQKYHVIVVVGSTDGTAEVIRSQYPMVEIITGDGNLWWTGAIALGMKYAYERGAEVLIWLNDDCQISCSTIDNLVSFAGGSGCDRRLSGSRA